MTIYILIITIWQKFSGHQDICFLSSRQRTVFWGFPKVWRGVWFQVSEISPGASSTMMPNLGTTGAVVWKCIMTDKHSLFSMRKKKVGGSKSKANPVPGYEGP